MKIVVNEEELLDHRFIVAGRHPRPHFRGFYSLLLDELSDIDIVGYEENFSDTFLDRYRGNLVCIAQHYMTELTLRDRLYQTIMVDHGPFPPCYRVWDTYRGDYLVSNGTSELLKHIDLSCVGDVNLSGYFPTDHFLDEREDRAAMVQITGCDPCRFKVAEICSVLLNENYTVDVYDHLMYKSDLSHMPHEVRYVQPGLDYLHRLSSCSHFLFSGTSGFITCMHSQGCHLVCLSDEWRKKNSSIVQDLLTDTCETVDDDQEVIHALEQPSRYDTRVTEYLFGKNNNHVIDGIRDYFIQIARNK